MKNRIKELRWVKPEDLRDDTRNWRRHPQAQRDAMQAMLDSVGIVDAVIARETPDGLVLIDGHLRKGMIDEPIPVLIVDLDEEESGQVLATLDPLTSMAEANIDALRNLVADTLPPVDWGQMMPDVEIMRRAIVRESHVTDRDVEKAGREIQPQANRYIRRDVKCPECGHEFQVVA